MRKPNIRAALRPRVRWLAAALFTTVTLLPRPAPADPVTDLNQALLAEAVSLQFYNLNAGKSFLTAGGSSDLSALGSMLTEIKAGHQAHMTMLQQLLGASARPMPAFQNLDAAALPQFLTMAQTLEDIDVGVHQGVLASGLQSGSLNPLSGTTSSPGGIYGLEAAVLMDDARYDGAVRAFVRTIPTAEGGNPNGTLTQTGTPLAPGLTAAQATQALQSYLVSSTTGSTNTTGSTSTSTSAGTTGGTAPSTSGTTPPATTGTTPPATTGTTAPATGGTTTPSTSGTTAPTTGGTSPPAATVSFSKDILRIFTNNGGKTCAQPFCHSGPNPQMGQNLSAATAYANIVNVPSMERPALLRVKPGDAANSYLYQKITGAPGIFGSRMPEVGGPLAASDIALIQQWINEGAPNN